MTHDSLRRALRKFKEGGLSEEEILRHLQDLPYEDLDFAKVDHHRSLRQGFPEVVLGQGKSNEETLAIADSLLRHHPNLLVTRSHELVYQELKKKYPECRYYTRAHAISVVREPFRRGRGTIGVFSAGTSDIPVAEEAVATAETLGNEVRACYDVGVAGLHRILGQKEILRACTVVIVVAGMEGALPSVVGGLVPVPVIAVPTSIGYGASFGGLAALLGMLNSCAANVSTVNIDNGFGAGYVASLINLDRRSDPGPESL